MKDHLLFQRKKLVERIVLIEGTARTGKFFLGNLLCGLEDIKHYQFHKLLEHILILQRHDLIDDETAKAIIQCQVDNYTYDYLMGRTINFRLDDKSSIYNIPNYEDHLKDMINSNGDKVVKEIREGTKYFPFIVHDVFPNIQFFFELYPQLKVVHIERDPVDLAYSWYQRGWGKRWGLDLKDFSLSFQGKKGPLPWFTYKCKKEYETGNEMDRIIISLAYIMKMNKETYTRMSNEQKNKVHCITYEGLLTDTDNEISRLSKFFNKKILSEIRIMKIREDLPREHPKRIRPKKLALIKKEADPKYLSLLMELEEEYQKNGNMCVENKRK